MASEMENPNLANSEGGRRRASMIVSPETIAYRVLMASEPGEYIEASTVVEALAVLNEQSEAVHKGDLSRAESMLMAQATALQSIFARLVEKGMSGATLPTFEINMRMALRAQNQCRSTLETLAAIKNPPVVFAKQANVTTGPQQVNNGVAAPAHAREIEIGQNQLLKEVDHGQRLDIGAPGESISLDPAMATVGEVYRPNKRRRKTPVSNAGLQGRQSTDDA
jgi:hypothetical protein